MEVLLTALLLLGLLIADKVVGVFLAPFKNRDSSRGTTFSGRNVTVRGKNGRTYHYHYFD